MRFSIGEPDSRLAPLYIRWLAAGSSIASKRMCAYAKRGVTVDEAGGAADGGAQPSRAASEF